MFRTMLRNLRDQAIKQPWTVLEVAAVSAAAFLAWRALDLTVIPTFTKAVLEERNAQLELDITKREGQLKTLEVEKTQLDAKLGALDQERLQLQKNLEKRQGEITDAEARLATVEREMARVSRDSLDLVNRLENDRRRAQAEVDALNQQKREMESALAEIHRQNRRYVLEQLHKRVFASAARHGFRPSWQTLQAIKKERSKLSAGASQHFVLWSFELGVLMSQGPSDTTVSELYSGSSASKFSPKSTGWMLGADERASGRDIYMSHLDLPELAVLQTDARQRFVQQVTKFIDEHVEAFSQELSFLGLYSDELTKEQYDAELIRHFQAHQRFVAAVERLRKAIGEI